MSDIIIPPISSKLKEASSWLINAGIEDTKQRLTAMTGNEDDMEVLRHAIASEKAAQARPSRLKPMEAKLRKFATSARDTLLENRKASTSQLSTLNSQPPHSALPAHHSKTEVVTPKQAVLMDAAKALEKLRNVVVKHEETFHAQTLGPRLQIGLQCLKAHAAFAIPADKNKRGGRPSKNPVTRDAVSPEGFEGWLSTEAQWLKKPTAYKYMTAVRGLGLDHAATQKQVAHALKLLLRKGPVTIASLCAAAVDAIGPEPAKDNNPQQTEFEFLRKGLVDFRTQADALLALKTQLHENPDMERVASARVYSLLHELTGTHWKPSDEPDELASVDPDAITI